MKNGTPHSRYFSDELGVPIILIDTEQMFALQRDAWYNICLLYTSDAADE